MWYNTHRLNNLSIKCKCNQCGEQLILEKTITRKSDRSFAPVVVNTYRCSNKLCQEGIDQRVAKKIEIRHEQEMARQKRLQKVVPKNISRNNHA